MVKKLIHAFEHNCLILQMRYQQQPKRYVPKKFLSIDIDFKSPLSNKFYTLCLNYEYGFLPKVWIVEPNLSLLSNLPHVFSAENNRLCLFKADTQPWSSHQDILSTIIVWSQMWVVYYEIWAILGKWIGPEAKHDIPKTTSSCEKESKDTQQNLPKYLKDYPIRPNSFI